MEGLLWNLPDAILHRTSITSRKPPETAECTWNATYRPRNYRDTSRNLIDNNHIGHRTSINSLTHQELRSILGLACFKLGCCRREFGYLQIPALCMDVSRASKGSFATF